jgi:hypothetical protein
LFFKAVLAAIIVVAVKNMCMEIVVIKNIYKKSKLEAVSIGDFYFG